MFGFRIIKNKEFNKLKQIKKFLEIRNKDLFIQTKDQETKIELLKQEINYLKIPIKTKEIKILSEESIEKKPKNNEQSEELLLKNMMDALKPLKELNYFTYRELEILSTIKNNKLSIKELSSIHKVSRESIRENLKNIRKKFTQYNFELFEIKPNGLDKVFCINHETFELAKEKAKKNP